jgi:hypothetical protein
MALFNWKKKEVILRENSDSLSGKPEHELQPVKVDTTRNIEEKEFELNIEKILENWEVYHAI